MLHSSTGVVRENPQGGGVFIHQFYLRLAEIKTPPKRKKEKLKGFLKENSWGWGFYSLTELSDVRLAKIKTPPPWEFSRRTPLVTNLFPLQIHFGVYFIAKHTV